MAPLGTNSDQWVADVATFTRTAFGNSASAVTPAHVAAARATATARRSPWTYPELVSSLPRLLVPDASWRVSASHNNDQARAALDYTRWSTGMPQQSGMWFQVELPTPQTLMELQFESQVLPAGRGGGPPSIAHAAAYRVTLSSDGVSWGPPVAEGRGDGRSTIASFAPTSARFIRITLTGGGEPATPWTIERLRLYGAPTPNAGGGTR
jgi:hypothetical protein